MEWCDQAMIVANYGLIYFTPISIALVESFAGFALFFFFVKRGMAFYVHLKDLLLRGISPSFLGKVRLFFSSFKPVENYLNWPMGVFILAGFVSILFSKYPLLSLKGFFFKLLEWTFLYFIFVECVRTRKRLKIFMLVFLVSAILVIASGLVQGMTKVDFIRGYASSDGRITSSFNHANDLGAYLLVVTLISIAFVFFNGHKDFLKIKKRSAWLSFVLRVSSIVFSLLCMVCLGLTYSRGAWAAFFVSLIFLGLLRIKKIYISFLFIIFFIAVFFPGLEKKRNVYFATDTVTVQTQVKQDSPAPSPKPAPTPLSESPQKINTSHPVMFSEKPDVFKHHPQKLAWGETLKSFRASGRETFWRNSVGIIRRFPFGIGLNTYSRVSHEYDFAYGYPHNCYLQLTAEMGFFGLFAFIWIIIALFKNSIGNLRQIKDPLLSSLLLGSLAGLFGFLIHSGVDTNFYSVQLGNFMWLVMGIVVASQKIGLPANNERTK